MSMKTRTTGATLALSALAVMVAAGCATPYGETPLATNFPTTKQEKVQAAAHWNMIARDVAARLASRVGGKPVHVAAGKSEFERAFANHLISVLVESGQPVLKQPDGGLGVDLDTQVVKFSPDRPRYRHVGKATALATGLWALHVGEATAGAVLFTALATNDAYAWFHSEFATGATPKTEIIVTTSASDGKQYLFRDTSVYYVADSDEALYEAGLTAHTIRATGGQ